MQLMGPLLLFRGAPAARCCFQQFTTRWLMRTVIPFGPKPIAELCAPANSLLSGIYDPLGILLPLASTVPQSGTAAAVAELKR